MDIDKAMIKKLIKEQMIDELKYGDSDLICCDNIIDELSSEVEEEEVADIIFEEWRKYVDKIEEFLKTIN